MIDEDFKGTLTPEIWEVAKEELIEMIIKGLKYRKEKREFDILLEGDYNIEYQLFKLERQYLNRKLNKVKV